jgi:hypothetical protein
MAGDVGMIQMTEWKIGPTFVPELQAAGETLDGYGWDIMSGAFGFNDDVPQAVRDQVAAVYAAHDPAAQTDPPTPWPPGIPTQQPANQWGVPRERVIRRLVAAGKLTEFASEIDNASREMRELWYARADIRNDDAAIIALIRNAGADPAAILARL